MTDKKVIQVIEEIEDCMFKSYYHNTLNPRQVWIMNISKWEEIKDKYGANNLTSETMSKYENQITKLKNQIIKLKGKKKKMTIEIKYKQFVIIPRDPVMSAGKIASQTAHATFMALEQQRANLYDVDGNYIPDQDDIINDWKKSGMCVIVLQCETALQLMGIAKYLEQWNIPHHLYIDEGITEIPMGTPTALATGVMEKEQHLMLAELELFR